MKKSADIASHYIRNFVFGVEDSLVSTVGLLSGIAVAGVPRAQIFLTGVVLIFVEAFSMGVGSYLSESAVEDSDRNHKHAAITLRSSFIMFFSYFVSGFIPLSPYVFTEDNIFALSLSVTFSLVALLVLGVVSGRMTSSPKPWKQGVRMLLIGGSAVIIGVIVGILLDVKK